MRTFGLDSVASAVFLLTLAACSDSTAPDDDGAGELVVSGSPQVASPALGSALLTSPVGTPVGSPSSFLVGLYSFHVSANADCSPPFVTAFDNGATPHVTDFVTEPELFRADVDAGSYPCVVMRITDVLEFVSGVTSGSCVSGTSYTGDIYRTDNDDSFRDLTLAVTPATGTEDTPGEDGPYIFFSTDRPAVIARGYHENQVIPLTSGLTVPDEVTFVWDVSNAVATTEDGRCLLEPEAPALFH